MEHKSTAAAPPLRRSGITLMEVLISIGILSIGLASVVALIPAGGSQAKKSIIEDRRGAMGAGALADVVNYGILNPSTWSTLPPSPYRVVFDPVGNGSFPSAAGLTAITAAGIAPGSAVANIVFTAADDLIYVDDATQSDPGDSPPVAMLTSDSARRQTEGGYSWLATLVPNTTSAASQFYTLSVVEFYRRPPGGTAMTLSVSGAFAAQSDLSVDLSGTSLADEDFRRLFPSGGVLLFTNNTTIYGWRRIQLASPTVSAGMVTAVQIALDRATPPGATTMYALEGAVGVIDRGVQLEGTSQWTQ
jgi:hypothetical protein